MSKQHKTAAPERRFTSGSNIGLRKAQSGKQTLAGYAAVFAPARSEDLGGWFEELDAHCFDDCLRSKPDVACLWNHSTDMLPLGRTTSNTLRLSVDKNGLRYEVDLAPESQFATDLAVAVSRGDVSKSSFGFRATQDSWRQDPDGTVVRTVLKADLIDVSPVVFPAYSQTTVNARASITKAPAAIRRLISLRAKQETKTKTVDGVELPASSFAYVGDPEKPATWKLPIYFPSDEQKTIDHIKDALARFNQTEGIPASEQAHVYAKIVGAAKAHGITVTAEKLEDRDWDDDGWDDSDDDDSDDDQTDPTSSDCDDDDDDDADCDDEEYSRSAALELIARRLR